MLTTVQLVRAVPPFVSTAQVSNQWLNALIDAADRAIKKYLKRNIELEALTEYYNGTGTPDIVLFQYPVLCGHTTIAAGSNNQSLPQSTINVASTVGFDPVTGIRATTNPGAISVQTGPNSFSSVTYTGLTATTFTGCTGGTGTLTTGNAVNSPVVSLDQGGYGGQAPNAFQNANANLQLIQGTNFMTVLDSGGRVSHRGILRMIGGGLGGWWGGYGQLNQYVGKLAAYRLPSWPTGYLNIKVQYSAGYEEVPADLQYAATALVAYMVRNQPYGGDPLQSESLGAYSYSLLSGAGSQNQVLGSIITTLSRYREASW